MSVFHTKGLAPRIYNLLRLFDPTGLPADLEQLEILAEMNAFNIEGRYPESLIPPPSIEEGKEYLAKAKEAFEWLINQL